MSAVPAVALPRSASAGGVAELAGSEFSFDQADFERVRQLIYQRAGISLHEGKRAMVYSRLSRRLRETGHRSFGSYLQWLELASGANGASEWQEFINCLTTNLTAFFREEHHFVALAEDVQSRRGGPLRIWCNAASTGEEPYSIAMTVAEALGSTASVQIVASDIDTKVLATAEAGVYAADARRLLGRRRRRLYAQLDPRPRHRGRARRPRSAHSAQGLQGPHPRTTHSI